MLPPSKMVFLGHISNRLLSVAHSVSRKYTQSIKVVSDFHFEQRKSAKITQKSTGHCPKAFTGYLPSLLQCAPPWTSVQSVQIKIFNYRRRESLMLQKWTTGTPSMWHLCDGATKTRRAEYIIILEINKEDQNFIFVTPWTKSGYLGDFWCPQKGHL